MKAGKTANPSCSSCSRTLVPVASMDWVAMLKSDHTTNLATRLLAPVRALGYRDRGPSAVPSKQDEPHRWRLSGSGVAPGARRSMIHQLREIKWRANTAATYRLRDFASGAWAHHCRPAS